MAERKIGRGLSKVALAKMKVATIVVSVVAFVGSVGVINATGAGLANRSGAAAQAQAISGFQTLSSRRRGASLSGFGQGQATSVVPLVRTRGS